MKNEREYILGVIQTQRLVIRKFMPCRYDVLYRAVLLQIISQHLKTKEKVRVVRLVQELALELFFCISLLFFIYTLSVVYLYSRDSTFRIREIYRDSMPLYFTFYGMNLATSLIILYLYCCKDLYSKEKIEHLHFLDELENMIQNMSNKQFSLLIDNAKEKSIWLSVMLKITLD